jgi:hypothetical protein
MAMTSYTVMVFLVCFFFFFLLVLGFELNASGLLDRHSTTWAMSPLFCVGYFWDRVLQTICLGWLQMAFLLISASWVSSIIGVSHWCQLYIYIGWNCCLNSGLWTCKADTLPFEPQLQSAPKYYGLHFFLTFDAHFSLTNLINLLHNMTNFFFQPIHFKSYQWKPWLSPGRQTTTQSSPTCAIVSVNSLDTVLWKPNRYLIPACNHTLKHFEALHLPPSSEITILSNIPNFRTFSLTS